MNCSGLVAGFAGDFPADEFTLSLNPIVCHQKVFRVLCAQFHKDDYTWFIYTTVVSCAM